MGTSCRDSRVWQLATELIAEVYAQTRGFPKEEIYGLTSQVRRSTVSVPSNIAEGKGRSTDRDRALFFVTLADLSSSLRRNFLSLNIWNTSFRSMLRGLQQRLPNLVEC